MCRSFHLRISWSDNLDGFVCRKSFFLTTENWVVVSKIFYFHPYLGKWSNLTKIFQMGRNHQLEKQIITVFFPKDFWVYFFLGWWTIIVSLRSHFIEHSPTFTIDCLWMVYRKRYKSCSQGGKCSGCSDVLLCSMGVITFKPLVAIYDSYQCFEVNHSRSTTITHLFGGPLPPDFHVYILEYVF